MMKKIVCAALFCLAAGSASFAQTNKRLTSEDVQNLFGSTTHVVTTDDNIVLDAILKKAADESWKVTPLEKGDYDYGQANQSFLMISRDVFEKNASDNSYQFLTLLQGRVGAENVGNLPWVISLPLSSDTNESQLDEDVLIDLLVRATQNHVELIKWEPSQAKQSLSKLYNGNVGSMKGKTVYMMDEDLSSALDRDKLLSLFNGHLKLVGPAEIERLIKEKTENAIIAYTVTGGYCYKLLIGVSDGKIYYFNRDKVMNNFVYPAGFLQNDINKISVPFK